MESFECDDLTLTVEQEGAREFSKVSYPIRYGLFTEIKTSDYLFQFNLNGEIKYIQGRGRSWPHPAEWLKRTSGNDWIYYSSGDYKGVFEVMGEYYFPCLSYGSNSIFGETPFENDAVQSALTGWSDCASKLATCFSNSIPGRAKQLMTLIAENNPKTLALKSRRLHQMIGGRVTVLPPDTRHVDYDVIPIMVADGCLYRCGFCRVKSGQEFSRRDRGNILKQIADLKRFYARDLRNYNSLFIGEHDALRAGRETITFAVENAYRQFEFEASNMKEPRLFLFGSADSLVDAPENLFEAMDRFPFLTYINIGLESGDPGTLALLRKPISAQKVREAFTRMLDVNRTYKNIEVTANFVFGKELPEGHLPSFFELTKGKINPLSIKGALYLSPLIGIKTKDHVSSREILRSFKSVKARSPLPTYIYLIQRL